MLNRFFLLFLIIAQSVVAQDFNSKVVVDASMIGQTNREVFEELGKSLNDFVNNTAWTSRNLKTIEKIKASFYLNITDYQDNSFKGTLQIQYTRPIYNSIYQSPVLMIKDSDFAFSYTQFQPLVLSKNNLDSNLVGVFAYYVYLIIGLDADTYAERGGTPFYSEALAIADVARSQNFSGWNTTVGSTSRSKLAQDLSSNSSAVFRSALLKYHFEGLDQMTENPMVAKTVIAESISSLVSLYNRESNSPLIKMFMDAKAQEITSLFSQGPEIKVDKLRENLIRMAPIFSNLWNTIQ